MYLLPQLEVNGRIHVRSTYALYFGANLKLLYDASCHLTLGASKIGNKLSSLSYCLIWIIGNVDFVDLQLLMFLVDVYFCGNDACRELFGYSFWS